MSDELRDFLANARAAAKILAPDFQQHVDRSASWGLAALRGRLVELSARGASATLTAATELVIEAQREGEPVAWIMGPLGSFYPPDVADSGVDLAALVVVRIPDLSLASRVAERLLRSSAFGLVVLDLSVSAGNIDLPIAHQGRLVTLAQAHDAAVLCLTEKSADTASIGSLISLRAEALRMRTGPEMEMTMRVIKDKRRGPGFTRTRKMRGPAGL